MILQNAKIGKKIGFGFTIVLCLTVIVGTAGHFAIKSVIDDYNLYMEIGKVQNSFASAKGFMNRYLLKGYDERPGRVGQGSEPLNKKERTGITM